ncbi:FUN30 [Candida theae]|uniref:DNA helicase n=1 Tax=Candida theae TaxID=1198502 RepID=A0AAD5BIE8_9ASCO|nr:FUN30 [Candida theae]KAI5965429.1 FUN30 [Candida theae]
MSWNSNGEKFNGTRNGSVSATPQKENYVQVPSSSPIIIKSSPSDEVERAAQPSFNSKIDEQKQIEIEKKRQKIREHKDFPLIRKRFYYLSESDIFKGFVKGKGIVRDVTKWLEDNYSYSDYLKKQKAEREARLKQEESMRQKVREDRLKREYEAGLGQKSEQVEQGEKVGTVYDDEDESPVKMKGKARVKIEATSPSKDDQSSTKVEIKTRQSLLNKYKSQGPKQTTLERFGRLGSLSNDVTKKRKLVKGSLFDRSHSPSSASVSPVPAPSSLSAKFSFDNNNNSTSSLHSSETSSQVDELEESERRIAENLKLAKLRKQQLSSRQQVRGSNKQNAIEISDDEDILGDDDASDSMSDEDLDMNDEEGLTTIDAKILEFINNAPIEDLVDISNIEPETAELVIKSRPYQTIYDISENDFSQDESKKNSRKKKMGMRIIEQTESSLKGYKAIDSLVKKCAEYGDVISSQMKKWGVSETGENGELDTVDLDPVSDDEIKDTEEEDGQGDDDDDEVVVVKKKGLRYIKHKPALLDEQITLNNYQQVGLNWINLLYHHKLSCILADEMGLGKTCQVIAFMAHLKQAGEQGPHLVVVPASTIENWIREFNKFCPDIKVQAYYGSQSEREELRYELQDADFDVLVTTYSLACGSPQDAKFLKHQNFNVVVYDEGHLLKNSQSERYTKLMKLKGQFRLLLTGTPLQNNLKELVSLLSFILPEVFNEKREDLVGIFRQKASRVSENGKSSLKEYNPLLSMQAIKNAKMMMTPFVLRRRKDQVLQHLPAKCHEIVHCKLTSDQAELYNKFLNDGRRIRSERIRRKNLSPSEVIKLSKTDPIPTSSNVLMQLRKAALHPLLFRVRYTDEKIKSMAKAIMNEPEYVEANETYIYEDMTVMSDFELHNLCVKFPHTLKKWQLDESSFLDSGKVVELQRILDIIINSKGEKVLIFSLFTQVLNILEKVLSIFKYKFVRLDGGTKVEERQETIDMYYEDDTIPIFLLSTKAGGFGINLVAANNVIIFDQSFNPHDDKQAEDRAHRVGQTKEVTVYKFITEKTVETNILMVAENKLQLDYSISSNEATDSSKFEENAASIFEKILFEDKSS